MTAEPLPSSWLDQAPTEWLEAYAAALDERRQRILHLLAVRRQQSRQRVSPTRTSYDPQRTR